MTRKKPAATNPPKKWFYPYCRTKQGFCNADGKKIDSARCNNLDFPDLCGHFLANHPLTGFPPEMLQTQEDNYDGYDIFKI